MIMMTALLWFSLALSVAVLYTCPGFTVYYFEEEETQIFNRVIDGEWKLLLCQKQVAAILYLPDDIFCASFLNLRLQLFAVLK